MGLYFIVREHIELDWMDIAMANGSGQLTFQRKVFGVLLVVMLFLYLHPYYGIRHDSNLYLGQVLLKHDPVNLGEDLFFFYGGQTGFTIFPQLIAPALNWISAPQLFQILTIVSTSIFLIASAVLIIQFLPLRFVFYGVISLIVLPSLYGGMSVFSYAEDFFTARSLAEPLLLFSFAAFISGRWLLVGLLWLFAASLHPLQAIPVLIFYWCFLVLQDRRWLLGLSIPLVMLILGVLQVPGSSLWMKVYDQEWFSWIKDVNQDVFLTRWSFSDWMQLGVDIFFLFLLGRERETKLQKYAQGLLANLILACLLSLVFVDWLHFSLLTGLQLWRAQWIAHWMVIACVPWLIKREFDTHHFHDVRAWILVSVVLLNSTIVAGVPVAFALPILIVLYFIYPRLDGLLSATSIALIKTGLVLLLVLSAGRYFVHMYLNYLQVNGQREYFRVEFATLSFPPIAACLIFIMLRSSSERLLNSLMVGLFLIMGVAFATQSWDRRNDWTRYIESIDGNSKIFGVEIEPKAQVLWSDEVLAPWLILHRPSYFSTAQSAGLLFSRETAKEASRRADGLGLIDLQTNICRMMNRLNQGVAGVQECKISKNVVADLCKNSNGKLDYLVLNDKVDAPEIGVWSLNEPVLGRYNINYFLYRCTDF
ncbi:MAG: hypothetical protein JOY84_04415 [Curvibacter sp.]|nr:hypothetical protein [Curvibacter sp.]